MLFIALLGLLFLPGTGATVAGVLRDPLAMLGLRSPGARGDGALFNTKPDRAKPEAPGERVLAMVRERPLPDFIVPPAKAPEPFGEDPLVTPDLILVDVGLTPIVPIDPPVLRRPPNCCIRWTLSPVPEPSTWMMMMLGVFAAGSAMRTRNRHGANRGTDAVLPDRS